MSQGSRAPEPTAADVARAALCSARDVYELSDGALTVAYYRRLCALGLIGVIAMNLFRAQKTSSRAKAYRGRQFKQASYGTKNFSLDQLCAALEKAPGWGVWGWARDPNTPGFEWVLYVDLPTGQVSFHSAVRGRGQDYSLPWDGIRDGSERRILEWCDSLLLAVAQDSSPLAFSEQ